MALWRCVAYAEGVKVVRGLGRQFPAGTGPRPQPLDAEMAGDEIVERAIC